LAANPPAAIAIAVAVVAIALLAWLASSHDLGEKRCSLFGEYELTNSELHHVLLALGAAGLDEYSEDGNHLLVPANKRAKYLLAVEEHGAVPLLFQSLKDVEPSPFLARQQHQMLERNRKRKQTREMILRLPFVTEAWLEIDETSLDDPFQAGNQSAVVMIRPRGFGALNKAQIETIQGIVTGAFATIRPQQVVVADANSGISYRNPSDAVEARLIESVHWTISRRQYYLDLFDRALQEFPGLEIDVEVNRVQAASKPEILDKVTSKIPAKLTKHQPDLPWQLTLNSTGEVQTNDQPIRQPPQPDGTRPATDLATANFSDTETCDRELKSLQHPSATESLRIQIDLPASLVAKFSPAAAKSNLNEAEKLQQLKEQITERIRNSLPHSATIDSISIAVTGGQCAGSDSQAGPTLAGLSRYFPIAAGGVALIGLLLIALAWNRNKTPSSGNPADEKLSSDEQLRLQNQLTELIESDPATAAKLIKSWLRKAA
jgi:hypothetical protein